MLEKKKTVFKNPEVDHDLVTFYSVELLDLIKSRYSCRAIFWGCRAGRGMRCVKSQFKIMPIVSCFIKLLNLLHDLIFIHHSRSYYTAPAKKSAVGRSMNPHYGGLVDGTNSTR